MSAADYSGFEARLIALKAPIDYMFLMHSSIDLPSRSMAEAILAEAPDCIKILSVDGAVRFVNDHGIRLMEAESMDSFYGIRYADLWPCEMREEVEEAIRGAANGETTRVEGYCPTLKGAPRWWEVCFRAVRVSAGHEVEIVGVSRDISTRRPQELALRVEELRFAALVEAAEDGICETGPDGRLTFINSAGAGMLGYRADELIGSVWHDTFQHHRADGSEYVAADSPLSAVMRTGTAVRMENEVIWHKDGRPLPTHVYVYPFNLLRRGRGVVVTFNDVTERERIEADVRRLASELSDAERRITEFIATLAHELRNPLAPIRSGLQLMRKAGDDPAAVGHVREMMERQVGHMVHLIGDLLDIARVTSGKVELKKECIAVHTIIDAALEASNVNICAGGHSLHVEIPHSPLYVNGDATRLAQIFTNLLNNAAKYTATGGKIDVRVTRLQDSVMIDVADTGIGLANDALVSIFEMFTKVGREIEGQPGGLGIGLNLVRRLAELHGGRVIAKSEGLGKGSHFLVSLPLALPGEQSVDAEIRTPRIREPARVRVLLVDDNVDAAMSLSLLLELEQHVTRVANSGADALRLVKEFKPDIVFLDIGMPGMNGYEVAQAIREMPNDLNPVLVALTGWGGEYDRARSKHAGFDEHLTKPADITVIERLLAGLDQPSGPPAL